MSGNQEEYPMKVITCKAAEYIPKGSLIVLSRGLTLARLYVPEDLPIGVAARDIQKGETIEISYSEESPNTKDVIRKTGSAQ